MLGKNILGSKTTLDYCEYKKLSDEVRNDTRLLDKIEQNNIAFPSKSNPKKFWSYINSKVKSYNKIGDLINNKNDSTSQILAITNEDKVDIFNNYFSSVFINVTYE